MQIRCPFFNLENFSQSSQRERQCLGMSTLLDILDIRQDFPSDPVNNKKPRTERDDRGLFTLL